MPIVNFSVPTTLDRRIARTIKKKGFASKAEFFRHAAINFLDDDEALRPIESDPELNYLINEIEKGVAAKYGGKKLPPVREQLANT